MGFKKKFGAGTAVVASCGVVALLVTASPGVAADEYDYNNANQINSTVRKSVSVTSDANGKVNNSIMVTQVSSVGKGQTTVNVPVNATSARNLDGFGGTTVNNQEAVFNLNVNGNQEERIMTNSGPGPIEITAEATLDGQPIEPSQVVDKTGVLKVKYTVVNTEKQVVEVATRDEKGNESTEEQEVDAPIGGSVAITLPQGFNEITAPGGTMGGNGQGGTDISYSLVMFKPLGDPVATVEYEARISNGTLPAAKFTMVPIIPMENSTIKTARSSFETGVETGDKIADAGKQIGDGAGQLETGIATAADGASQLAEGLNGKLLPGANALAAGADQLASGITGTLQPGANELADGINGTLKPGANELADGINGTLKPGANAIADGVKNTLSPGVKALYDAITFKATKPDQTPGLAQGIGQLNDGIKSLQSQVEGLPTNPLVKSLIDQTVAAAECLESGGCDIDLPSPPYPSGTTATVPDPATVQSLANGAWSNLTSSGWCSTVVGAGPQGQCKALAGAAALYAAYGNGFGEQLADEVPELIPTLSYLLLVGTGDGGINDLATGSALINAGVNGPNPKSPTLVEGITALNEGVNGSSDESLLNGTQALADGINDKVAPGATQLADGINDKVAPGASQLADGINDTLAPGAGQLADGANQLADGVPAAADGASQLAAGLPAAVDGAGKLSDGGKQLEAQGQAAAGQFASQVNGIDAVQKLGLEGVGIPNGGKATGENVTTTGAYSINLQAAKTPEQNNGLRFGLAALALIIAGGVGTVIYRRRQGLGG